jgi:hypothetical protein
MSEFDSQTDPRSTQLLFTAIIEAEPAKLVKAKAIRPGVAPLLLRSANAQIAALLKDMSDDEAAKVRKLFEELPMYYVVGPWPTTPPTQSGGTGTTPPAQVYCGACGQKLP